jgi:hypothetical protein
MIVLLTAEHLGRHEHGTSNYSFRIGKTGRHAKVNHFCPSLLRKINDVLQFEIAVVYSHIVKGLDPQ